MSGTLTQSTHENHLHRKAHSASRVQSVDALRGLVMFTMIFVNDLGIANHVPPSMKHFRGYSGMTFVDLVYPAFLFIVGMSIPLALWPRLQRREPMWKILAHVLLRTVALLAIGIMMVNSDLGPSSARMGWSATVWSALAYIAAILSFCSILPGGTNAPEDRKVFWRRITLIVRIIGLAILLALALTYRGDKGQHLLQLRPLSIRHSWYGILGVIGWDYFVASIIYLIFRNGRTALLAAMALVMSLYATGDYFSQFWIGHLVNIPNAIGSHGAVSVAGVLLGSILLTSDTTSPAVRIKFTAWFILGCVIAAFLLTPLWGISKERGTPAWCFIACAITAALWLIFDLIDDPLRARGHAEAARHRGKKCAAGVFDQRDAGDADGSGTYLAI